MAGKAYSLPRPGPDPQPKHAGADNVGYEEGFRPRARYAQSNATKTWEAKQIPITTQQHCNIQPRISLADAMNAETARRFGVSPHTPGRRPAPRVEIGCPHGDAELAELSSALARDLSYSSGGGTTYFPGGQPRTGPPLKPPGLDPLPKPPAPKPREPPVVTRPTTPPQPPPPAPTTPPTTEPPYSPRVPGTLQPINFHFTGDIAGGAVDSELRVFGPVGTPFIIKQIWISPDSGVAPGQFFDLLVSNDGETTDTTTPSGQSIFPLLDGLAAIPTPDEQRGIAVPPIQQDVRLAYRVDNQNSWLKLRTFFIAPAIALPNIHITVTIERMDVPGMRPPPLRPRPPLDDPYAPPVIPRSTPPFLPEGPVRTFRPDANQTATTAPAWRVASLGLEFAPTRGFIGTYPNVDSFAAWLISPYGTDAELFRARIEKVLAAADAPAGDWNHYVDLSLTLPATD